MTKAEEVKNYIRDVISLERGCYGKGQVEVLEVWHCYILGNEKWMYAVAHNGVLTVDYFEVTYSQVKGETYVDRYIKKHNQIF